MPFVFVETALARRRDIEINFVDDIGFVYGINNVKSVLLAPFLKYQGF